MQTEHNFKKHFGQNFITNIDIMLRTIDILDLKENDNVLEIGPGDGRFTEAIIQKVKHTTLVEIDFELVQYLKEKFTNLLDQNLKIVNDDILSFDIDQYLDLNKISNWKLFGALPYNISKQIIQKFFENENRPEIMVFVLQKEVAENYAAEFPKATFLSNYAKIYADTKYEFSIGKEHFFPQPKVESAVISMKPLENPRENPSEFTKFLKNGFRSPRKKLLNTVKSIYKEENWEDIFQKVNLGENARAAELEFEKWIEIFEEFKN